MELGFFGGFFLSLLLGALLGVQWEIKQQKEKKRDFAGIRTYSLISLLGFISGFLSDKFFQNSLFFFILFGGFLLLIISTYIVVGFVYKKEKVFISGQITAIFSFLIGFIVNVGEYYISVLLALTLSLILFFGNELHLFTKKLNHEEIYATLKFAIVSLIILPVLPNKNYSLMDFPYISDFFRSQNFVSVSLLEKIDVFNFYKIWLVVVLILAISYVGYILMKFLGSSKGVLITGFLGGLMSSTALTISFSNESKKNSELSSALATGIIIACSTMFFRIIFEMVLLKVIVPIAIILFLVMGITGYICALVLSRSVLQKSFQNPNHKLISPFKFMYALKFSLLFLFMLFISKLLIIKFGSSGIYFVSFFSGIIDADAISISLAHFVANGSLEVLIAGIGIFLASIANTLFKIFIIFFMGERNLLIKVIPSFSVIIIFGILALAIVL